MFVSQAQRPEGSRDEVAGAGRSQRKRPAPSPPAGDVIDDIAPAVAAVKRRRIAAGEDPAPRIVSPEPAEEEAAPQPLQQEKTKKAQKPTRKGKENDILELARQRREAAEKRQAEERDHLAEIPEEGIDFEEIRRLTIVEEIEIRQPPLAARSRDQDITDGRWDARWNGRRNFKKFRKQGDSVGRPAQRVIVGLEPVKLNEYGIGDKYWLEDNGEREGSGPARRSQNTERMESHIQTGPKGPKGKGKEKSLVSVVIDSDSDSDEDRAQNDSIAEPEPNLPRSRASKAAEKANSSRQTQSLAKAQAQSQQPGKRAAAAPPVSEQPAREHGGR